MFRSVHLTCGQMLSREQRKGPSSTTPVSIRTLVGAQDIRRGPTVALRHVRIGIYLIIDIISIVVR